MSNLLYGSPLPALRPLDIQPIHGEGEAPLFSVRDPARIATQPLAVSLGGYFVMMCLNGELTTDDVRRLSGEQFGRMIEPEQVEALVAALDEHLYLLTDRFEAEYARRTAAYREAPLRDSRDRWEPEGPLREELHRKLAQVSDRTRNLLPELSRGLRGIVAPHLDYARGGPGYADAFAVVAAAGPVRRVVILGTNHFGLSAGVVATAKDFLTPLGLVRTDRALIARIAGRMSADLCAEEFDHEQEHSIDLPLHILQHLQPAADFEIAPFLVPDPSRPVVVGEEPAPTAAADVDRFARTLADEIAADGVPTLIIASADLSHVGQSFGDETPTTMPRMDDVARTDLDLLSLLERGETESLLERVRSTKNATRVCSVGCLYAQRLALAGAGFHLLRYHQAVSIETETSVTCAAAALCDRHGDLQ
ncbi:MAG: AmmeMemoRadiSam system protein B [Phycisphaerales bacterium]|nr:AmmeMemoRadiSam system protein B [Phycisphaerales bacterium]